jgi:hypothetical protein
VLKLFCFLFIIEIHDPMVRRSADARLLSNLVSHEKDYSKQLQALLTASQSLLQSLLLPLRPLPISVRPLDRH